MNAWVDQLSHNYAKDSYSSEAKFVPAAQLAYSYVVSGFFDGCHIAIAVAIDVME